MRLSMLRLVKFGPQVKELRVHLCQTGAESQGARLVIDLGCYATKFKLLFTNFREFVQKYYVNIKRDNPKLPILIRECSGVQPRLWTRMGKATIQFYSKFLDVNIYFLQSKARRSQFLSLMFQLMAS
jgi:NADH dehydrogenase (ubiquinone) 1 alpha subcomplex subunit 2